MKTTLAGATLAGLLILFASCQSAEDAKLSSATDRNGDFRRDTLQNEINRLGKHPWAGKYYQGDGLGVNVSVSIAPANGFAFSWQGCLGLYDQNYGSVTETNRVLKLKFALPNERRGFQGLAEVFVPIHWGDRTYLIADDEIVDFCNDVNSGREPRIRAHGRHLLRAGDENKQATGEPEVPPQFRKYLLKKPITASIVAVGKASTRPSVSSFNFRDVEATVDAGSKEGVVPGMDMHAVSPGAAFETVKITRVKDDTAFGIITQIGENQSMPQIGWRFSTKP